MTAASGACFGARTLVLSMLGLLASGARAEQVGTVPHHNGTVQLMTELCRADDPGSGRRAQRTVEGRVRHGCWGVDPAGNPIVTWSDGSELELDGDKLRLSPRMAALLEGRAEALRPHVPPEAPMPPIRTRPEVPSVAVAEPPSRNAAEPGDFARPAWCPDALFPHEQLVCADAELADRDLYLASLWGPYRRTLSRAAEAWHKSDYFRRLRACGADRDCVFDEQETQMRLYRERLPGGG